MIPFLPFRAQWIALITEFEWNHHFADGLLGELAQRFFVSRQLQRTFRYRQKGGTGKFVELGTGRVGRVSDPSHHGL